MSGFLMGLVYYFDFTRAQRDVMLNLCDHAHDDGSDCRPSLPTLCWKTASDRRNVQKTMRQLEDMGVLVPVAYGRGGRGHATEYEIHILAAPIKPTPPPGPKMRKIWEMLKGGTITADSADSDDTAANSGTITADSDVKGGSNATVSQNGVKGGNSRAERAVIHAERAVIHAEKGGNSTAPTIIEPLVNHQENHARTRTTFSASKIETEEPDPDPEPPPDCAAPPPPFNQFAADYRRRHGVGSRYSDITAAYWDTFNMTPHETELVRAGVATEGR